MNGGTNIAAAIKRAAALLKAGAPRAASRSLVLLTDGRVDGYQVRAPAPGPRLQPPGAAALL
jgi:Mg-chelatase subunit ChlD